tara:strand:+ start:368 stop:814 length:447 start_codon:yes stop_codon:yes gene_type:complete
MRYSVGTVLYIISKKSNSVIPVQVIEEVTRKTVEGQNVTYVVMPPGPEAESVHLEKLEALVFNNPSEAREHMMRNASSAIDKIIEKARTIAENSFSVPENLSTLATPLAPSTASETALPSILSPSAEENVQVDLGNGIKARVSMSGIS